MPQAINMPLDYLQSAAMTTKKLSIYGSTGSIGTQALDVVKSLGNIEVVALACNSNIELLEKQVREHKPKFAAVIDTKKAQEIKDKISDTSTKVVSGVEDAIEVCSKEEIETVINATVGISGLLPTIEFLRRKKNVGLANKESLVTGGKLVMDLAKGANGTILPIDSEHSAIFQALRGNDSKSIEKIILTASGGPFRGYTKEQLRHVTLEQALNHPNWKMGPKITVDSATLFNKALELIEACVLFGVGPEKVEVVVHPQSIFHSGIMYVDGSVIPQMGRPDMRVPIQYALTYPSREQNHFPRLDFDNLNLTFEKLDTGVFRSVELAKEALRMGGMATTILNGANEKANELFRAGKIAFLDIADAVEGALENVPNSQDVSIERILETDSAARKYVEGRMGQDSP